MKCIKSFTLNEDGAITVDWIVLSATLVALALATVATVRLGIFGAVLNMSTSMADIDFETTP